MYHKTIYRDMDILFQNGLKWALYLSLQVYVKCLEQSQ